MKKQKISAWIFFILGIILTVIELSALNPQPPIISDRLEGKAWVEKCIEQYPEILWLADANVRKTEQGEATLNAPYSEQLFGQKFIEFDRTIMTLHCLRLILDGSESAYQTFTNDQPKEVKLTRESFERLHCQGKKLLESRWQGLSPLQMTQAMETALVLGDLGKSEIARKIFKCYGANAPDHDDFHEEALSILKTNPLISPSFARLPPSAKKLLTAAANLIHYGHVTHLEGGTSMFSKLKQSGIASSDPLAFTFDLFVHICDVAGSLGHVNNQSSILYTEHTYRALQAVEDSVLVLVDPVKTEWDVYNAYLSIRSGWLGLDPEDELDRVVVRLGAMLRLFTPEDGSLIKNAVLKLKFNDFERVRTQMEIKQDPSHLRTPTYMPAVLVNLHNNTKLGQSQSERLSQSIAIGVPFIAKVLEKNQELLFKKLRDPEIPLNFNQIAAVAKTTPYLLSQSQFIIDQEGNVLLIPVILTETH